MKPPGELFLEQTQSRRLGMDIKKEMRRPRGREVRPTPWARPHPRGPLVAPLTDFLCQEASLFELSVWFGLLD